MYLCKRNRASSEKNANWGSISHSTADCRKQLQKWALLAGLRGCKACMNYCCCTGGALQKLCWRSRTRLWHSSLLSYFLDVRSSLASMSSNFSVSTRRFFCSLAIKTRLSKFIRQITNCLSAGKFFVRKFWPTLSNRFVFHLGVIMKHTLL
jgi:hypothetical protein